MFRRRRKIFSACVIVLLPLCGVTLLLNSEEVVVHNSKTQENKIHIQVITTRPGSNRTWINQGTLPVTKVSKHSKFVRQHKPMRMKDIMKTRIAKILLRKYQRKFNSSRSRFYPGRATTINRWWEAAALFDWHLQSSLKYTCKRKLTNIDNWFTCQDPPYTVTPPCLVYSFGIAYDFSFDDGWGSLGCEVRSFDPSMTNVSSHRRSQNVWFHRYGLYDRNIDNFKPDIDEYVTTDQLWEVRTLKYLVRELGHEGKTIDILKIDIESTEWPVLDNLIKTDMLKNVRHLLIEFHLFPTRPSKLNYVHYFEILIKLNELGFQKYYSRSHSLMLDPQAFRHQGEVSYMNVNLHSDRRRLGKKRKN